MSRLLLDTCAMIFVSLGEDLRRQSRDAMEKAIDADEALTVSPFSAWEVGVQAAKGRFVLSQRPEKWFADFTARRGVALAPLTPAVLVASSFLPGAPPRDPADRIIAATAREYGLTLVTRDRALLAYADEGHVLAIEC